MNKSVELESGGEDSDELAPMKVSDIDDKENEEGSEPKPPILQYP